YADRARIDDYLAGKADAPLTTAEDEELTSRLAAEILSLIEREPKYFQEIAEHLCEYEFSAVARAMGRLHAEHKLWQDAEGRACVRDSVHAARPPR
ncbi:MAG: hypothetical protein OXF98_08220, partial [Rhodospirillaceae bacterium]|nr:hypothetical protein [Rhodospirillaceae bacterium]